MDDAGSSDLQTGADAAADIYRSVDITTDSRQVKLKPRKLRPLNTEEHNADVGGPGSLTLSAKYCRADLLATSNAEIADDKYAPVLTRKYYGEGKH